MARKKPDDDPDLREETGQFKKGQSGNPGGRPRKDIRLVELAQEQTQKALDTLVRIMGDEEAPHAARLTAANSILDRAHGKPRQALEHTGKDGTPLSPPLNLEDRMELGKRLAFTLAEVAHNMPAENTEPKQE